MMASARANCRINSSYARVPRMAKKRKSPQRDAKPKSQEEKPIFASPFKDLKKMLAERPPVKPAPSPAKKSSVSLNLKAQTKPSAPPADETELLRQAFEGVRPLGGSRAERLAVDPPVSQNIVSEDAEVLAELSDLISGQGTFELTETEEYVEGARVGLDPRLVSRLRRGEFSVQAHIDLHGMIQPDAKEALNQFILASVRKGHRAVLVVHGRGLRSPGGQPVLKHAAAQWLSHGTIGGYVLAFATARAYDGGAGAMWVLLRRERRRAKFDVLQGAKRRD
jgi:DNA-nicking Smr family endonuclease